MRKRAGEKEEVTKAKESLKTSGERVTEVPEDIEIKETLEEKEEETLKGDIEHLEEDKEKEITKVLEEAYKQDLEKDFTLAEDGGGEDRQKKKTDKLLKKIEEQELEETKVKKKGMLKRKVIIKEEDHYAARRQRPKGGSFRKDRKERGSERRAIEEEEEKKEAKPARKIVKVSDDIQVGELAKRMNVKAQDIIAKLFPLGIIATVNKSIDYDTAYLAATELGFEVERIVSIEDDFQAREEEEKGSEETCSQDPLLSPLWDT